MLQRLAPLAGKPVPEVRRASQDERHAPVPVSAAPETAPAAPGPVLPPVAGPPPDQLYAAIASIPGASDTVRSIFGGGA